MIEAVDYRLHQDRVLAVDSESFPTISVIPVRGGKRVPKL
jgi:hypothetical protein